MSNMNEDNGFVLKPEMYSQIEWCQMFLSMLKECKKIQQENKQLEQENKQLKENIEDYERILNIWNKRKLINKFNKEFSKEKVKEERAKGNKIVGVIPDAEYVYKKYYEKVEQIDKAIEYIENDLQSFLYSIEYKTLLEILNGGENNR